MYIYIFGLKFCSVVSHQRARAASLLLYVYLCIYLQIRIYVYIYVCVYVYICSAAPARFRRIARVESSGNLVERVGQQLEQCLAPSKAELRLQVE